MPQLIVAQLFELNRERLHLEWICGSMNDAVSVRQPDVSPADLVGHLNLIHPGRIQVLGTPEIRWAHGRQADKVNHYMVEIVAARPPAMIVADGCDIPEMLRDLCERGNIPLFATTLSAATIIDSLRLYLARQLAETASLHGVFMDVLGMGVLITGESGVGKSELGLELISRGHGLVADDVVEVSRLGPDSLEGRCPELLRDFLEVRGLGLLNIRTIFGEAASRRKMKLKLIVHLQKLQPGVPEATRLPLDAQTETILGIPIRKVVIPVAAGRNLAVLLEAAVRSTILQFRGIDNMQEFLDRQQQALSSDNYD
ncbi:HPr kinase/phosphorylase [Sterolibacterium denitrificans]|uniref:HPr kinase/phosphorylase n=1 Tax=Sterolibacterium denitrificans TaxID=157592 RepID=A0A7Z7HQR2_9PROT|nr:HPr(Ser) kinase/phosphatase [Sterolibacterium denitrificans]SMB23761.1 HPr kinase/phosphorylase [Sterolibacterium denitrificans]